MLCDSGVHVLDLIEGTQFLPGVLRVDVGSRRRQGQVAVVDLKSLGVNGNVQGEATWRSGLGSNEIKLGLRHSAC